MATRAVKDFTTEVPGELNFESEWIFPPVKSVNKHGRSTSWVIRVALMRGDDEVPVLPEYQQNRPMPAYLRARIMVDSGVLGGKIRKVDPTYVTQGKNIGKKNETNVWCQALQDAKSIWDKKCKGVNSGDAAPNSRYPPMLAKIYAEEQPDLSNGAWVQPKLDGHRSVACLEGQDVILYSRKLTLAAGLKHIGQELLEPLARLWESRKVYLDGEAYLHGVELQDIAGLARREVADGAVPEQMIEYHVYDCFLPDEPELTYAARYQILQQFFADTQGLRYTKMVEAIPVSSDAEVQRLYTEYREQKYEGAMIRLDVEYVYSYNDYHTGGLLKLKPAFDHEFPVIGWTVSEKGKTAGALMVICEATDRDGKKTPFSVTPKKTIQERLALAKKFAEQEGDRTHFENHWLGREIVVTFDAYSNKRVPLRARTTLESRID